MDYGERRIGLAVSDPSATIAGPLPGILRRRGKRPPVQAVARAALEHGATEIVIGLPLSPAGTETDWTAEVRRFGALLHERTGLPVTFRDERMTSARAERAIRELELPLQQRRRKERIDAAAAVLILQAYLDRRPRA